MLNGTEVAANVPEEEEELYEPLGFFRLRFWPFQDIEIVDGFPYSTELPNISTFPPMFARHDHAS